MVLETITERGVLSTTNSAEFSADNTAPYCLKHGNIVSSTALVVDIGSEEKEAEGKVIDLIAGRGAGQKRIVSEVNGNEITVNKQWNVIPDTTTKFVIHQNSGQCRIQTQDSPINTIKLSSAESAGLRFYDYCYIKLIKGSGKGQIYEILNYDATEKIITIDGRHNISPNSSTYYIIYGESGTCTSATATTATLNNISGAVKEKHYIEITEGKGQGQIRMITGISSTTVSVAEWDTIPDSTSLYNIYGGWGSENYENILRHSVITITSDINISGGESTIISLESAMDTSGKNSLQNITELSYYVPTESHSVTVSTQFFRLRFISMGTQISGRVQTIINSYKSSKLNYKIEGNITDHSGCDLSRSVIAGKTVGGEYTNIQADKTGNIWTSIKSPIDGFGSVITTQPRQYTELMFLNNLINVSSVITETAGGSISASNNICSITTTAGTSSACLYTIKRMRYNPGLAIMIRFTAIFSEPEENSRQLIGYGDCCDGLFFGYDGTQFGVLHRRGGKCEIRRLTITSGASGDENINITLNDVKSADIAILGTDNTFQIARKIAMSGVFAVMGWNVYEEGNSVLFISRYSTPLSGAYSTATTATMSFSSVCSGVVPSEFWTYQPDWNKDTCSNMNDMPYINFQRGNVFEIGIQWLGFGNITFKIENPRTGYFGEVHQLKYSNENNLTSLENPNLPLYIYASGSGATAGVWVKTPSMGMFIMEDHNKTIGGRLGISSHHYTGDKTLNAGTYYNLITLRNMPVLNGNRNYNEIFALALSLCYGAGSAIKRGGIFTFFANVLLDNSAGLTWTKRNVFVSTVEYSKDIVEFTGGSELLSIPVSINSGYSMPITDLEFVVIPNIAVTLAFKPFETLTSGDNGADITFSVSWIQR